MTSITETHDNIENDDTLQNLEYDDTNQELINLGYNNTHNISNFLQV